MSNLNLKPTKLGKNIELKYIPFSQLAIPWNLSIDSIQPKQDSVNFTPSGVPIHGTIKTKSQRTSKTMKRRDLEALKNSIGQYGLLKPFEVAELPERLDYFYGEKTKYLVIDGQRRYFAIRELLRLPTLQNEKEQKDSLRTNTGQDHIEKAETQAQQQFDKLSIRDYVLIPCLVYPYKTFLQMVRHSTEDKKFSEKPSKEDLESAEKMHHEGVPDLTPEDLTELWETRSKIEEERQAIEKTLQQIRKKMKEGKIGQDKTKPEHKQDTLIAQEKSIKAQAQS